MRARGIVLALGGAREFGDALLEDGVASRFALECGARPLVYHALRAIARASRYACEKITVVCEGDAHAAIVRECASAWAVEWGTTPTIEVTAVDEGAGGGDALAAATRDDEAAEMKDTALIVVNGDVVMDVDVDVRRDASLGRPAKLFLHEMRHQIQSYALQMRRFSQRPQRLRAVQHVRAHVRQIRPNHHLSVIIQRRPMQLEPFLRLIFFSTR